MSLGKLPQQSHGWWSALEIGNECTSARNSIAKAATSVLNTRKELPAGRGIRCSKWKATTWEFSGHFRPMSNRIGHSWVEPQTNSEAHDIDVERAWGTADFSKFAVPVHPWHTLPYIEGSIDGISISKWCQHYTPELCERLAEAAAVTLQQQ